MRHALIVLAVLLAGCSDSDSEPAKRVAELWRDCKGTVTAEVTLGMWNKSLTVRCQETR